MTIDTVFIEKLKADSAEAFETVYNMYAPQLLNYCAARLSSLEESRDLVHDVFVSFYERKGELDINVSIRTYLFAALKYKMIDHIRKNTHRNYYKEMTLSLNLETEETVLEQTVYNNLNWIMDQEVERLPGRMRETFILSRRHHLTVSEIATQMNVSEQTVKNQLTTALKKLRIILDRIALVLLLLGFISHVF